jgi:ribose 1,5-bisphosphokinase PhnN
MTNLTGNFIYLIGFAGSGKLTIANALRQRMDCIVVDNHHVNNVIFKLIDPDGVTPLPAAVWERVREVRGAVLATIRDISKSGRNFVFTNELLEGNARHARVFREVQEVAIARAAKLIPVRLRIEADELARRVAYPGRAAAYKDIDAEAARRRAREAQVFQPQGINCFDLDVTLLSAEEAAMKILAYVRTAA